MTTITEEGGLWQEKKKQIKKKAKPPSWRNGRTWQGGQAKIRGVRKRKGLSLSTCVRPSTTEPGIGFAAEFSSLALKQKSGRIRWKAELKLNPGGGLEEPRIIPWLILNLLMRF